MTAPRFAAGSGAAVDWLLPPPPPVQPEPWPHRLLDAIAATPHAFVGLAVPAYRALGIVGVGVGVAVLVTLGLLHDIPLSFSISLTIAALTAFIGTAWIRRKALGTERHVLLEDLSIAIGVGAALAWIEGQPVPLCLYIETVALGVFLVFGRLGCLTAGCCHGRPARFGICYRTPESVPRALLGLRLFPVQLVEAAWLAVGTVLTASLTATPGARAWFFLLWYAIGRFVLEFARGDLERPLLFNLSEAQWISVFLVGARVLVEEIPLRVGGTPRICAMLATCTLLIVAVCRRSRWLAAPASRIGSENVLAWRTLLADLDRTATACTGEAMAELAGLSIAVTVDRADRGWLRCYVVTCSEIEIAPDEELLLAGLVIERLVRPRLIRCARDQHGVLHLWAVGEGEGLAIDDPRYLWMRVVAFSLEAASWRSPNFGDAAR